MVGRAYLGKGDASNAIPHFKTVTEHAPEDPSGFFHLDLAYAKAGDPEKAKASLRKALQLNQEFPEVEEARQVLESLP